MNSIALAPTSASRSLRDLKCPTNLQEERNRPQTLHVPCRGKLDTDTPVSVQAKRDPVTSGHASLTHKLTTSFTYSNFSMSYSGVPLPKLPLFTAKSRDVSPQETSKDFKGCHHHKRPQRIPPIASSLPPKCSQTLWAALASVERREGDDARQAERGTTTTPPPLPFQII